MTRLFGTDGIRGLANRDLTAELALEVSTAAARVLGESGSLGGRRLRAVIGRDTRASGEFLSAATIAGLASAGVDVFDAGVLPTPAVAYLVAHQGFDLGAMLSASHNAMPDNGIKFFAAGGHKLLDSIEDAIERRLKEQWTRPVGAEVGRVRALVGGADDYVEHLLRAMPRRLDGLHIVFDGANGAASDVGPRVLRQAGARVTVVGGAPDGLNINDGCGSTHLGLLQERVVTHRADLGIAVDGDADRCLAVDAQGNVVDGDHIMTIVALSLKRAGRLTHDTVVVTVMSNLGMLQALDREGIAYRQTAVGDRYVLEEMRRGGFNLGGEQSGHVVLGDHGTTGDGLLTGLMLGSVLTETGQSLHDLAAVMRRLPQVLINVSGVDKAKVDTDTGLKDAVAEVEAGLGSNGRVLLRKSGTEPLVRVMVEADSHLRADAAAQQLADCVRRRLALDV